MIGFCRTNNSYKKRARNTSPKFYKYANINTTVLCEDNSSYSLIVTLNLSLMGGAGSAILLQGLRKHATLLRIVF